MTKRHTLFTATRIALIAGMVVSIVACAQPPEEEMAAARQAVERAEANEDVSRYAPESLEEAQQLLSEMESAAENEEYDSARSLAEETREAAEQAVQDATDAKTAARDRAEQAVATARDALQEARTTLRDARDVAGIDFDFQATGDDLDGVGDTISAAESDLQAERYPEAEAAAESARSVISDAVRRISNAVQAASRK